MSPNSGALVAEQDAEFGLIREHHPEPLCCIPVLVFSGLLKTLLLLFLAQEGHGDGYSAPVAYLLQPVEGCATGNLDDRLVSLLGYL